LIKVWLLSDAALNIPVAGIAWNLEYTDA